MATVESVVSGVELAGTQLVDGKGAQARSGRLFDGDACIGSKPRRRLGACCNLDAGPPHAFCRCKSGKTLAAPVFQHEVLVPPRSWLGKPQDAQAASDVPCP